MEYNLQTRNQIPKDYECCYNCEFMSWMVAIGQGVRCGNEKNRYRVFVGDKKIKLPVIPGVAKKCEHFSNIRRETIKQQRKDMLKKYEGKLSGPYDHLKEGVDYLDDIQRNKNIKGGRMTLRADIGDNRTMPLRHDIDVDKILEEIKVVGEDWKTDGICQIMIQGAEGKEDDVYFGSREFKEIAEAGYTEQDFIIPLFPGMIYTNNLLKELKIYRSRLMLLKPKSCLSWHHDPSMRIHIPLCGDSDSFHLIENIEGTKEVYHIYPGEVHLMNTEVYHSGINLSRKVSRIHIVGCINVDDENN